MIARDLRNESKDIQLFQERLSYKSVKAYATKSKGIMGNAVNKAQWLGSPANIKGAKKDASI